MFHLIRSEWKFLLFGFLMTFWSFPGQTFFISIFSGDIRAELNLSDGQFGGIYSLATLMSAIVILWSGSLIDRFDLKRFSITVVVGLVGGCLLIAFSYQVVFLIIGIFLLRQFGQGLMCLASSTAMVRYLTNNKGKSSALAGMGYAVSEAVIPSVAVYLVLGFGWREAWIIVAVVAFVAMLLSIILLLREHHKRHQKYLGELPVESGVSSDPGRIESDGNQKQWTRAHVLTDKRFYLFLPGLMSQQLMFTGFIFHQIHLVESKGWSLSGWASLFAVYAMVSVGTKLLTGIIVDRYGAIRLVPFIGLPMGVGLAILSMTQGLFWGGAFLVLTGITVGLQSTVSAPFWAEMYGLRYLASIKSLGAAIMVFFTALSPVLLGVLIDFGVTIEALAFGGAIYILLTSILALYAYGLTKKSIRV